MLEPIYVKGQISFTVGDYPLEFTHRNISAFGVMGLPWGPLNQRDHFGSPVTVKIKLTTPDPISMEVPAYIMSEHTIHAEHMGLRFQLTPQQIAQVTAQIKKHGFHPTDHVRKYPRIPSTSTIPTFPLRVLAAPSREDQPRSSDIIPIVFDVCNLSPNGLLLSTENQLSLSIVPGERLDLVLEPRGSFPVQIRVEALVCRVTDALNIDNANLMRFLGVKFTRIDEVNRATFLDLFKDILERLKTR